MATGVVMQCDLGPPGAEVTVTVTYDTASLVVQGVTYANASSQDAVGEAWHSGTLARSYRLGAGAPVNTIDVSKQGLQLVPVTIQKPSGPVTIADWPDGWSFAVRWPA